MCALSPHDILRQYWGYDDFRPAQLDIIESVLAGHDTIGLLPTGGGKSLTFQVPAMIFEGLTLVVTPLISLMKDQVDNLYDHGIKAVYFHSGQTRREQKLSLDRCRLGISKLAYVSPEKLRQQSFLEEIRQWHISALVVDEAHCISQWGYDFRPSYLNIKELRHILPDSVPVLALTASATPAVVADIAEKLEMHSHRVFSRSFVRDNISYIVRHNEHKDEMLLRVLANTSGSSIVYVRSRLRTRELAELIKAAGISADFYHAGLSPEEKSQRQDMWKTDKTRVIVATNAFGMGIDKPDVRVVVHYDLPSSIEEYYQEAGRAGRDGRHSYAVVLCAKNDKALLTRRLADSFPPKDYILQVYDKLCVFLGVTVGGGYNNVYDCDFDRFCMTFSLKPAPTRAAVAILSRSGYIEYVDETMTHARVTVLVDRRDFYSLELDVMTDRVLQALLRLYPGLFSDYVTISEQRLASAISVKETDVTNALVILARMHVIHYIPRRVTPYVYFPTSRELSKYLCIPRAVYEERRDDMKARLESMKQFAFAENRCRSRIILEYFGEKNARDCGHCDYCRSNRRGADTKDAEAEIKMRVMAYLREADCPLTFRSLVDAFPTRRQLATDIIRELADRGVLIIEGSAVKLP